MLMNPVVLTGNDVATGVIRRQHQHENENENEIHSMHCRLPIHLQSLYLRIIHSAQTRHITYASEMSLSTPLTRLLGMKHPIVSAGMYIAGGPELVAAVSNAGEAHQVPSCYYL
jgi:hypothetical protein